jgi:hypothetical protein
VETLRGKRGISIAASEIVRAPATPRVLVSSRRYLARRAAVTRIVGPRFRGIASNGNARLVEDLRRVREDSRAEIELEAYARLYSLGILAYERERGYVVRSPLFKELV